MRETIIHFNVISNLDKNTLQFSLSTVVIKNLFITFLPNILNRISLFDWNANNHYPRVLSYMDIFQRILQQFIHWLPLRENIPGEILSLNKFHRPPGKFIIQFSITYPPAQRHRIFYFCIFLSITSWSISRHMHMRSLVRWICIFFSSSFRIIFALADVRGTCKISQCREPVDLFVTDGVD